MELEQTNNDPDMVIEVENTTVRIFFGSENLEQLMVNHIRRTETDNKIP